MILMKNIEDTGKSTEYNSKPPMMKHFKSVILCAIIVVQLIFLILEALQSVAADYIPNQSKINTDIVEDSDIQGNVWISKNGKDEGLDFDRVYTGLVYTSAYLNKSDILEEIERNFGISVTDLKVTEISSGQDKLAIKIEGSKFELEILIVKDVTTGNDVDYSIFGLTEDNFQYEQAPGSNFGSSNQGRTIKYIPNIGTIQVGNTDGNSKILSNLYDQGYIYMEITQETDKDVDVKTVNNFCKALIEKVKFTYGDADTYIINEGYQREKIQDNPFTSFSDEERLKDSGDMEVLKEISRNADKTSESYHLNQKSVQVCSSSYIPDKTKESLGFLDINIKDIGLLIYGTSGQPLEIFFR